MDNITLTKSTDKFLQKIYKVYKKRIRVYKNKSSATYFDFCDFNKDFPKLNKNDIDNEIIELKNNGLIKLYTDGSFILNSEAIIYMENHFKSKISEISNAITKFIP